MPYTKTVHVSEYYGGGHGGLRYCGIELFFKQYFGSFDFNVRYCGIIQPCGMRFLSSFWLTGIGKRRSFTVLWYRSFALSCVNIWKTLDLTVNEYAVSEGYSMMKLVGHRVTWLFDRVPINSRSHVFSQMLRLIFWCIHALN